MSIFRNVVFLAALAGLIAGVFMSAVQTFATVPLILQAETYEQAEEAAPAGDTTAAAHDHDHGDEAWMPADGAERTFYTIAANVVTGIGFGLLLVAVSEFAGGISGWREGLGWGFAGFTVFTLAPGLGLPPELPGMPAAELAPRQLWWIATVALTAAGLWLIFLRRTAALAALGVALIVVPHLIGAPQPASHETDVPAGLHHSFVVAVTVSNLLFWLALGVAVGWLRPRFFGSATSRQSVPA